MNEKGTFYNELLMNQHNNRHTNKLNHIRRTNTLNRAVRRQKKIMTHFLFSGIFISL